MSLHHETNGEVPAAFLELAGLRCLRTMGRVSTQFDRRFGKGLRIPYVAVAKTKLGWQGGYNFYEDFTADGRFNDSFGTGLTRKRRALRPERSHVTIDSTCEGRP